MKQRAVLSSTEDQDVTDRLRAEFDCVTAAGAGHKLMAVALGDADLYLTAKVHAKHSDNGSNLKCTEIVVLHQF